MPSTAPQTRVSPRAHSAILLADDLTGAADSAAPFAALGATTRVVIEEGNAQEQRAGVISYALDTRNLPADAAKHRLTAVLERTAKPAPEILFLKIDSAGRGPIGASVVAALDGSGCDWALVTPAFPAQSRFVRDGILHVAAPCGDDPEARTRIPLDTLFPDNAHQTLARIGPEDAEGPREGLIKPENCKSASQFPTQAPLGWATVRLNPKALASRISAAIEDGKRILLCDAETQEDLVHLVGAARQVGHGRILWCGAAALARAVAESYYSDCSAETGTAVQFHAGRCTVLFVGTPHAVTNAQMEAIRLMSGVLCVDSSSIPERIPEDTRCVTVRVRCGETSDEFVQRVHGLAQRYGGGCGLVLTGGDTALMVLKALGTRSILLEGEVAAGIPWGIVEGGMADGIRVITKSGGFGAPTALVDTVNFLEQTR